MNRPLNFLHVTTFYPPYSFGGDAAYVYRLAAALADEGHHVDVLHSIDAYHVLHPADPDFRWKEHRGVTVHGLRSRAKWLTTLTAHQIGQPYLQRKEILSILDSRAYDVIHFHNISLFGPGVLTLNPARSRPLKVYTTHEHWLVCPMHVLWKFNERACEAPDCLSCTLQAGRPPQLWRYTNLLETATADVDLFLAPSQFVAAKHRERGFTRPFSVLPLFVDDHADEGGGEPPHQRPYVLYVGRLERMKGVETLFPAVDAVQNIDLLIVGGGADESRLKEMSGRSPRIRFLGTVPPERLGPLYRHALACLIPSLTFEVFPTVALESLARKTPIVARDLGGLTEIVEQSRGGILYKTESELIDALKRVAVDSEGRRAMGECGYRMVTCHWSKRAHLRSYLNLLETAAGKRQRPAALRS